MMKLTLYDTVSLRCSRIVTRGYSTSFSLGILMLGKKHRKAIYAIYGFVRLADEIVDTFLDQQQKKMLDEFRHDTCMAIKNGISMNPVLHSFQLAVNRYRIDMEYIEAFLLSMEMDLQQSSHDERSYNKYIYGSAEAVGLMCLRVFCHDDPEKFERLKQPARKLGSAFQKVNFLRDIKSDFTERGRVYFPGVDFNNFRSEDKITIENDIAAEFNEALTGIRGLDRGSRRGVYLAYSYYVALFRKIRQTPPGAVTLKRFRITDLRKILLLIKAVVYDFAGLI